MTRSLIHRVITGGRGAPLRRRLPKTNSRDVDADPQDVAPPTIARQAGTVSVGIETSSVRMARTKPLGPLASGKEGQNDYRVFCHNVAQAVVLYQEVPEAGVWLMLPDRIHLRKF